MVFVYLTEPRFCSKIAQYSPSEGTKVYDKAMQRRNIHPFNPKATIALLKENTKIGNQLSETEKKVLVDRYLEVSPMRFLLELLSYNFPFPAQFKQLMIKLDPEEEADDEEHPSAKTPQKTLMPPPNTSLAMTNDVTMNHLHTNNVQINLPRLNLPATITSQQNFVSC